MTPHPTPHLIGDAWIPGSGPLLSSLNPATGDPVWVGTSAAAPEVDAAVLAAAAAFPAWSSASLEQRTQALEAFASLLEKHAPRLSLAISEETGKPRWESRTEVAAMQSKIKFTLQAHRERRPDVLTSSGSQISATRFKPHGIAAVLGPFNLPGHLPNAHLAPALLAGNTAIFKPSELAPHTGQLLASLWQEAGLPPGVLNLIQGAHPTGELLVSHPGLNAIFFTGGVSAGRAIARARADTPEVILALELGGNNPLVVWDPCPIAPALHHTLVSAFITAGQRCTCARRLILPQGNFGDRFLQDLIAAARLLIPAPPTALPEPFLGPLISPDAAARALQARDSLVNLGASELLPMLSHGGAFLSPGILDCSAVPHPPDEEIFAPLLQVFRVDSFAGAIRMANQTSFGLSAGLLSQDPDLWEVFYREARAGIINWNTPLTGASGAQPFGGIGRSGNHRPSGYFAADYCSYPVASTSEPTLALPTHLPPGLTLPGYA